MQTVWAKIIGQPEEWNATGHLGSDFEQAAEAQIAEFVSITGGETKSGAVLVWAGSGSEKIEKVYDWIADFKIPDTSLYGEGEEVEVEVEGSVELTERTHEDTVHVKQPADAAMTVRYGTTFEEAARSIIYQHDYYEKHGDWDYVGDCPAVDLGQGFAGWACDLLESALLDAGHEPYNFDEEATKIHYEIP